MSTAFDWTEGEELDERRSQREQAARPERLRHNSFQKRKRPTGYNGMHRRRNKRTAT